MAKSPSPVSLGSMSSIFTTVIENLQLVIDQVKDGGNIREHDPKFSLDDFWKRTELVAKIISKESTTLCMAFLDSDIPNQQDCSKLIEALEKSVIAMISAFYSLPNTCGMTLRKEVQAAVLSLMRSVQQLIKVIQTEGGQGGQSQRTKTGNIWQRCEEFPKLPRDNVGAILKVSQSTSGLIRDALEEIQEEIDNGSNIIPGEIDDEENMEANSEDTWCEADKTLIAPCIGMVKATRSCLKKTLTAIRTHGSCEDEDHVAELDDLCETVKELSPIVDDVILSLYAPINHQLVNQNVTMLSSCLHTLLSKCKHSHVSTEDDAPWIEFLESAIEHNLDKVKGLVVQQDLT